MRKATLDVIAYIDCESGCKWEDDEYSIRIQTIGALDIDYLDRFGEAVQEWVSDMSERLENDCTYQLIMRHVMEFDGAGACYSAYFEVFDSSFEKW